ncbi:MULTISPECIES: RidA family protein [Pseudomonas]|uniref:Reactive intermediate/imine deaminase n=1 Tax=Pseudomonas gregormendelii TaxID=1628277 RepID=A0ABS3AMY4_9PSED|nr:RidA family protein [Pseudomonas gregormendelii]MBN3968524.1 reactive intermediate/imine deaminase [Pseudomonas gregormendelii]
MSGLNVVLARNTNDAAKSIGPYSQTVAFSHYNYISAQLPLDPASGKLVSENVRDQAKQCFQNIKSIVESIGHYMDDIIKVTIYLKDITNIDSAHEVYSTFFPNYVPVLTTIAVKDLPMGASIQIEALVSNGEGTIEGAPQEGNLIKTSRNTDSAPSCLLFSQSVAFSHYNNICAQLPIDSSTRKLVAGGVKEQAVQCLKNIQNILKSLDVPLDDIVKINIYLTDLMNIDAVDAAYKAFFPHSAIARSLAYYPARTLVAASALPMGALVQIEAVVSHGNGTPPQLVEDRHGIVIKANNAADAPKHPLSTQSVAFSHYNHVSAQLPLDPKTGELVGSTMKEQTEQCLKNIKSIVENVNHFLGDIVKINIHLKNIDDITTVNEIYTKFFPDGIPARTVIGVSALPHNALVQIDAIVSNAEGTPPKL